MVSGWDGFRDGFGTWDDFTERYYLRSASPAPTSLTPLDELLGGGMVPGIHVLGGEPGAGKSALALQVATLSAMAGRKVLYVSLEMSRGQCLSRCLSLVSDDTGHEFPWSAVPRMGRELRNRIEGVKRSGADPAQVVREANESDPVCLAKRFLEEKCGGLAVADGAELSELSTLASTSAKAREAGMELLIIDYLQRLRTEALGEYETVSSASKGLAGLAHSLDVPVLVLSSLNRQSNSNGSASMFGFKGSGQIEYDAESAWVLARDKNRASPEGKRAVALHVVKNRHGALTGEPIALSFDGAHNRLDPA